MQLIVEEAKMSGQVILLLDEIHRLDPDIFASSTISCISFLVFVTALSCLNLNCVLPEMALAILVLPIPGGP